MKRIIDHDPFTGVSTFMEYHADTDMTIVGRIQDVEPILERNKAMQNDVDYSRKGIAESWWHEARIPNIVIEKWRKDYGVDVLNKDHIKKVKNLLNSPEWKYLKTTAGRI